MCKGLKFDIYPLVSDKIRHSGFFILPHNIKFCQQTHFIEKSFYISNLTYVKMTNESQIDRLDIIKDSNSLNLENYFSFSLLLKSLFWFLEYFHLSAIQMSYYSLICLFLPFFILISSFCINIETLSLPLHYILLQQYFQWK